MIKNYRPFSIVYFQPVLLDYVDNRDLGYCVRMIPLIYFALQWNSSAERGQLKPIRIQQNWHNQLNQLQNRLELIIIEQIQMQKSSTINPNPAIFQPITEQSISLIQNDTLCLQSIFHLNRIDGPEINLALTNLFLATYQHHKNHAQYLYQAELTFEIKFQIIYEKEGKCPAEQVVHSTPVGFRIFKQNNAKIELYAKYNSLVHIWAKHLSQHLNQIGFHQMYKPVKKIGKGGFGVVYEVERVTDHKRFAAKSFSKQATIYSKDPSHKLNLLNQIQMLRSFDCPNIIKCQAVFQSQNSIYIILELLSCGNLHSMINEKQANFTTDEIKQFIRGMALGLKEMHDYRIMHRDIKPENIMMRSKTGLEPIIADFGLSADCDSEDYIFYKCGTPGYVAPEITTISKGVHIQPECDIFSLGAIFHILLVRRPLFEGKKSDEVYENNKKLKFNLNSSLYKSVDSQALDLLRRMLKADPKDRIKASEILSHPYIASSMEIEENKYTVSPSSTDCSAEGISFSLAERNF